MRLIDADDFKKFMQALCNAGAPYESVVELLDKQSTAYDIDKVIEELEKIRAKETCNKEKCDTKEICRICVVDDAIEIVKQGGVADDVCEWKFEETNGIAWHCDKKCTTYNQAYIKDLKITLEDFECKCPYCGKEIKVVE